MTEAFDIGDLITLFGMFVDVEGAPADPVTVTLTVKRPDGTYPDVLVEPVEVTDLERASVALATFMAAHDIASLSEVTGVYKSDVLIDQSGTWRYGWRGEGEVFAAESSWFDVRRDQVNLVPTS